ncbi:hypothetical protein [Bacillus sp. FJAT-44742]|uniref:hypothetical protein n=1 Tax=Bacillus sp. FJAT-44742 TaxID=2014005 RepID=UPI000C24BFE2|nr:hypothetical protein [Bacillus sp. FJAT-44742]
MKSYTRYIIQFEDGAFAYLEDDGYNTFQVHAYIYPTCGYFYTHHEAEMFFNELVSPKKFKFHGYNRKPKSIRKVTITLDD